MLVCEMNEAELKVLEDLKDQIKARDLVIKMFWERLNERERESVGTTLIKRLMGIK